MSAFSPRCVRCRNSVENAHAKPGGRVTARRSSALFQTGMSVARGCRFRCQRLASI
jgi:hypothetical protein